LNPVRKGKIAHLEHIPPMTGEQVRQKLHDGGRVYGTHVCGLSHAVANKILATAPLDFAFICNEHMPVDRAETSMLCQHFESLAISPIVRIPFPCARQSAMALDGGANGIVAPYVETVEEVKDLVGAVHYRPIKGRQLRQILDGSQPPGEPTREFLARFNRHHYAIIGIESVAAYENLDALISVPGVDGVFMGPHDLSVSLGAPEQWDNPALLRLIEDVIVRCRKAGIGVGVHLSPIFSPALTRRFVDMGMNWLLDSADVIFALNGLRKRRAELCGDAFPSKANLDSCLSAE
jgi:2-keto-3-deoxy-L-rhamnonate aldolase RhmA